MIFSQLGIYFVMFSLKLFVSLIFILLCTTCQDSYQNTSTALLLPTEPIHPSKTEIELTCSFSSSFYLCYIPVVESCLLYHLI